MKILMHAPMPIIGDYTIEDLHLAQNSSVGAMIHQYGIYTTLNRSDNQIDFINFYKNIGERMHGVMASIASGAPTILVTIDWRTQGLTEYHHIPHIKMCDLLEIESLEELFSKLTYTLDDMHNVHKKNFERYIKYYRDNDIKTIYDE